MDSIFSIFRSGLEKSATKISRSVTSVFGGKKAYSKEDFDLLEMNLVCADFGVCAAREIADECRDAYERGHIATDADLSAVFRNKVAEILKGPARQPAKAASGPTVYLFVGVNGSGKTTTIGKLGCHLAKSGAKVILGACDTFRAAASEQLNLWGTRAHAQVISSRTGADSASVAYDAVRAAVARQADYLLIDTAGRQQTSRALMEELSKVKRSIVKLLPGAPHEVLLTVDASLGSNAVSQARSFGESAGVTGMVLTKIDGTGRGGMIVALTKEFQLPAFYTGMGEKDEDLAEFNPDFYAEGLFPKEEA